MTNKEKYWLVKTGGLFSVDERDAPLLYGGIGGVGGGLYAWLVNKIRKKKGEDAVMNIMASSLAGAGAGLAGGLAADMYSPEKGWIPEGPLNRKNTWTNTNIPAGVLGGAAGMMGASALTAPWLDEDEPEEEHVKEAVRVFKRRPMWQRPLSSTIGRATSPLMAAILGTTTPLKPGTTAESAKKSVRGFKDNPDDIELAMYSGGPRPIRNLARIWQRPTSWTGKGKGLSPLGKILGTMSWPAAELQTALMRSDHYNPTAHSITSYMDDDAIKAHELGHAEDFNNVGYPTMYGFGRAMYPITMYQEAMASAHAIRNMQRQMEEDGIPEEEQENVLQNANRKLGGGIGTYATGPLALSAGLPATLAGAAVGQIIGHTTKPFSKIKDMMEKPRPKDMSAGEMEALMKQYAPA